MSEWKWKFRVRGSFIRAGTGKVISPCEAIVESGVRDEASPFSFAGVGPIARANSLGAFSSWFVTKGNDAPAACPDTVSVFVRVAQGKWQPYVVPVLSSHCTKLTPTELLLELGEVPIEHLPYVEP